MRLLLCFMTPGCTLEPVPAAPSKPSPPIASESPSVRSSVPSEQKVPEIARAVEPASPQSSPAASVEGTPEPARDVDGKIIRKPAATPVEAVCHGPLTACRCPDFTMVPEFEGRASLLRQGSFSGAFPEALVEIFGCEGHVDNWGGTVLVRKLKAGWVPIGYVRGFVPNSCSVHRGADGLERLACREAYGLNQGTFLTRASVVDFVGKHYDVLSESECDDARDVKSIRWLSPRSDKLDVEVVLEVGLTREQTDDSCRTTGGKARPLAVRYAAGDTGYAPTAEAETQLFKLIQIDPDFAVDPAVAGTMRQPAARATLPDDLRPERGPLVYEIP